MLRRAVPLVLVALVACGQTGGSTTAEGPSSSVPASPGGGSSGPTHHGGKAHRGVGAPSPTHGTGHHGGSIPSPSPPPSVSPSIGPAPSGTGDTLNSAGGASADDVWAVGSFTTSGGHSRTLTQHWDGRTWRGVAGPDVRPGGNR